jgi:hypothetical protein
LIIKLWHNVALFYDRIITISMQINKSFLLLWEGQLAILIQWTEETLLFPSTENKRLNTLEKSRGLIDESSTRYRPLH